MKVACDVCEKEFQTVFHRDEITCPHCSTNYEWDGRFYSCEHRIKFEEGRVQNIHHPFISSTSDRMKDDLADLIRDIREHGLREPITVEQKGGGYDVLDGNRRLRALRSLGWITIPCLIKNQ